MRIRLRSRHGRRRRPAGWTESPGRLPAPLAARPAVVHADRGRGAALPRGAHAWRRLAAARRGRRACGCAPGMSPSSAGRTPTRSPTTRVPRRRSSSAPGRRCTTPDGEEVPLMQYMGVRTWGNSPEGSTVMLNGTYEAEGEVSRRLMEALPPVLVLPADTWESPLLSLLATRDRQGRTRAGGRARPAARSPADRRRCAHGSRARTPRHPPGTAPTATRSSAWRCA